MLLAFLLLIISFFNIFSMKKASTFKEYEILTKKKANLLGDRIIVYFIRSNV